MSQWDSSNADSREATGTDASGHADDLETGRRKSLWEKRLEAAHAQRARVLSGEIAATPRRAPPARLIAKDDEIKQTVAVVTRPPDSLVERRWRPLRLLSSLRAVFADWSKKARSAAAMLHPRISRSYDRFTSRLAHVPTWRLPATMKHKKSAGIVVACICSLAVGYAIGNRSGGSDASQALAFGSVTENLLPILEESHGPIIVGRLVEPEPDVMASEPMSQEITPQEVLSLRPVPSEPVSQEQTAEQLASRDEASRDEGEMAAQEVPIRPAGLLVAEPVAPESPDILSDLSNIAWTSKIIVQPESVPDVSSAVVSLPPASPEIPPGGGPDEVVRLAGLPTQVGSLRMLVFAPDSVRASVLEDNLTRLNGAGAEISGLQRVGMRISTAHIRYFFEEDAEAAIDLGDTLGIEARSFLHMSGSEPGQVEVWLRGAAFPEKPEPEPDRPQSFRDRSSGDYR